MTPLNTLMAYERQRELVAAARRAHRRPVGSTAKGRRRGRRHDCPPAAPVLCLPDPR